MSEVDIGALAERVNAQGNRLDKVEGEQSWARQHIEQLGRDLADTERRLSEKQEAGFREVRTKIDKGNSDLQEYLRSRMDKVDDHLGQQDEKLEGRRNTWLLVVGTALGTGAILLLVAAATHLFGW